MGTEPAPDPLVLPQDEFAALKRVMALARSWATLPPQEDSRAEHLSDIDRRVGEWLLRVLDAGPEQALEGARVVATGWMMPGGDGLYYPAAGQAVLDAIRGGSTETEAGWQARAEAAEARLLELENAVTWNTSCASCARTLDSAYGETCRREQAEAKLAAIRELVEAGWPGILPDASGYAIPRILAITATEEKDHG